MPFFWFCAKCDWIAPANSTIPTKDSPDGKRYAVCPDCGTILGHVNSADGNVSVIRHEFKDKLKEKKQ